MTKNEAIRKYVDIKVFWWSIAENKEYPDETKVKLAKLARKMNKADLLQQIGFYENRIANAKLKLAI